MHNNDDAPAEPALISNKAMEIIVAMLLLSCSAAIIYDSVNIGFGWQEGLGPAPGYFPFYIAVIMAAAGAVNLLVAIISPKGEAAVFVSRRAFGSVLSVMVPTIVFVGLIDFLGLYVAAAIFIAGFMVGFGREPVWRAMLVGICVPLSLFMMFERWFLVPLPKGPLEAMLGFG